MLFLILRLFGLFVYSGIRFLNLITKKANIENDKLKEFDLYSCIGFPFLAIILYIYVFFDFILSISILEKYEWTLSGQYGPSYIDLPYTLTNDTLNKVFTPDIVLMKKQWNKRVITSLNENKKFKAIYIRKIISRSEKRAKAKRND